VQIIGINKGIIERRRERERERGIRGKSGWPQGGRGRLKEEEWVQPLDICN